MKLSRGERRYMNKYKKLRIVRSAYVFFLSTLSLTSVQKIDSIYIDDTSRR